jgi:hypothetical protein
VTSPLLADYNSDSSIAVIKRMSLYEDDISTLQIISACIITMDGTRPHFGQFIFSTSQLVTVLQATTASKWYCLGMYQKVLNMAYVLYNDRSAALPTGYTLYYGRIDYNLKKIDSIPIASHSGPSTYYGALFVHQARFFYFGDTSTINAATQKTYSMPVGFINIYDQQETTYSSVSPSQAFSFSGGSLITTSLDPIVASNMAWGSAGMSSEPKFSTVSGKQIKPFTLTGGLYSLNMADPLSVNTYQSIVTNPAPVTISAPSMAT